MELNKDTTIDQFRDEMQRRIVKYHPSSRPVREAVRFARRHEDPAYYRIAVDKVTAQKQYRREVFGPSRLEKALDLLNFGAPREVIVTLLLIVVGVACVEALKYFSSPPEGPVYSELDIDALADRLGIRIDEQVKAADSVPIPMSPAWPDPSGSEGMISSPKTPGADSSVPNATDAASIDALIRAMMLALAESPEFREAVRQRIDSGGILDATIAPETPQPHGDVVSTGPDAPAAEPSGETQPAGEEKGTSPTSDEPKAAGTKDTAPGPETKPPPAEEQPPVERKPQSPESQEQSPPQESAKDVEDEEPTRVTNLFRPGRSQWQAETPSSGRLQGQLYVRGATVPERTEDS